MLIIGFIGVWTRPAVISLMAVVAVCDCFPRQAFAQQNARAIEQRMIEVEGHAKRVVVGGLEGRKPGEPIVVFEAGLTHASDEWNKVLPEVATFAPVIAYDRSGLGNSDGDEQAPTPHHVTAMLRQLLQKVGASPPYVLVGYSWGGILMRYYAGYYPEDVAGVVYVDPGPLITLDHEEERAPFDSVGAGVAGYDAFWSGFASVFEKASPAAKAEFEAMRAVMQQEKRSRDLKPAPQVPVSVILSAKPYPFFLKLPYDQAAHFRADVRHRIRVLQEWALASPNGTIVISNTTTHAIPKEDPALIAWVIKRMVAR